MIELAVVAIMAVILLLIAIPGFLALAAKAKESEAEGYTGTVVRAQQAYYHIHQTFASDLSDLGIGIPRQTVNYDYHLIGGDEKRSDFVSIPRGQYAFFKGCAWFVDDVDPTKLAITTAVRRGNADVGLPDCP